MPINKNIERGLIKPFLKSFPLKFWCGIRARFLLIAIYVPPQAWAGPRSCSTRLARALFCLSLSTLDLLLLCHTLSINSVIIYYLPVVATHSYCCCYYWLINNIYIYSYYYCYLFVLLLLISSVSCYLFLLLLLLVSLPAVVNQNNYAQKMHKKSPWIQLEI